MGDELSANAHGDFGDGLRANVDAQRSVDPLKCFARDALVQQVLEDQLDLAAAADQAHVASAALCQVVESLLVVAVAAGHDQAVGVGRDIELREYGADLADDSLLSSWKPLGGND